MKWILIIAQLGYSSSGTTSNTACTTQPTANGIIYNTCPGIVNLGSGVATNNVIVVPPSKERSQTMDRDSCFKAAETVKKAFPAAEVSCEVVQ
jgi:hypothetical protein